MKLYYSPGACSMASHIILHEIGQPFTAERVNLATKTTASGVAFGTITPKGRVPTLELPSGDILTEGAAILQFIADSSGAANLAPATGTLARARVQEMLNFIAAELQPAFTPLFNPNASADAKAAAPGIIKKHFGTLEALLSGGRDYLTSDSFTVADAYAFVVVSWSAHVGVTLEAWPNLAAFMGRIGARPSVKATLVAEGLAA